MPATVAHRELKERQREIVRMLRPIRLSRDVGCTISAGPGGGVLALWAHEGLSGTRDYRDARFRTRAPDLWCQYFELWKESSTRDDLVLYSVCLNVYSVELDPRGFKELVCIHSEPTDQSDMKRGPHLHVVQAVQPIPKSHFPLNYQNLEDTLRSARTLTDALRAAIEILDREVIQRFCDGRAA